MITAPDAYHHEMPDARWLDEREAAAWQAVRDLGQPLWAALGRDLLRESGLSMADYHVLVVLSDTGAGSLPYRELACTTGWEKSRLSHQITRMERRGLVERHGCSDDGRAATITLTDEGRRVIEAAAPGHVAAVRKYLIDHLTDEQIGVLIEVAGQVSAAVGDEPSC